MRTRNMVLTAAVIGLAVVAGLLGVGGTWALWNAATESSPGTVRAANFDVTVNGRSVPPDGSAVSVALEDPSATLSPAREVHAVVTVVNATNASGPFTVRTDLGRPAPAPGTDTLLQQNLTLGTAPLASGTCSSLGSAAYSATATSVELAKGGSATYCVEVALRADAPSSLGGRTVTIVLPLSVSQLPAGA